MVASLEDGDCSTFASLLVPMVSLTGSDFPCLRWFLKSDGVCGVKKPRRSLSAPLDGGTPVVLRFDGGLVG